jgi:hypothetical protein
MHHAFRQRKARLLRHRARRRRFLTNSAGRSPSTALNKLTTTVRSALFPLSRGESLRPSGFSHRLRDEKSLLCWPPKLQTMCNHNSHFDISKIYAPHDPSRPNETALWFAPSKRRTTVFLDLCGFDAVWPLVSLGVSRVVGSNPAAPIRQRRIKQEREERRQGPFTPPPPRGSAKRRLDRDPLVLSNFFAGRLRQCQPDRQRVLYGWHRVTLGNRVAQLRDSPQG